MAMTQDIDYGTPAAKATKNNRKAVSSVISMAE